MLLTEKEKLTNLLGEELKTAVKDEDIEKINCLTATYAVLTDSKVNIKYISCKTYLKPPPNNLWMLIPLAILFITMILIYFA